MIIIIIIINVKIRVTLSWVTLQGHFTDVNIVHLSEQGHILIIQ